MECSHCSLDQTTFIQHLHPTDRPLCIQMLGSNESRCGMFRCLWSVVSPTYTWNYPAGLDHITNIEVGECTRTGLPAVSETISQRRLSMLGHMSRMPPSADAYKAIYQDIPSDWRTSTVLAGYHTPRSAETWYWLGQRSWTCCRSFTVEGADLWCYAPLWCMLLMMTIDY